MTEAIRDKRCGLWSRLHLAADGIWVAYAQWADQSAWERSREMEPADKRAAQIMAESIEESLPPMLLEPIIDLLELRRIKSAR